ncbi:hypothetical protein NQ317_016586, partial [Molorchus minor]
VAFTGASKIRREPCAKCGLPVFIAERLNVGKLLYHRTCFKCARCNSQLTLANYYETEHGDFCCEICPDEEKISTKSPEKSVLLRSMSDEEKTANLKTFSNEPDDYSAQFETALENAADLNSAFTLTRDESSEFTKARSHFFQSQLEDSCDSGTEDEPPDLPKTMPPPLDKSELDDIESTYDMKDSIISSADSDSGFPSNRLDIVNTNINKNSLGNLYDNASGKLEETHNFVTKDKTTAEGDTSLVKARMRLFETDKSADIKFRKSDPRKHSQNTEKVPLSSPTNDTSKIKAIPIVKLDDLENFEQLSKNELRLIDDNKTDKEKSNKKDSSINDNILDKYLGKHEQVEISNKDEVKTEDGIIEDRQNISDKKEVESPQLIVNESEDLNTDYSNIENSFKTSSSNSELNESKYVTISDSSIANNNSLQDKDISYTSTLTIETSNEATSDDIASPDSIQDIEDNTSKTTSPVDKAVSKPAKASKTAKEEDYPDTLNPFGDEDTDEKVEGIESQTQLNTSLNPFEDDGEEEIVNKPMPSPRVRRKLLPTDTDKQITGTPDHLSCVSIKRESINPFESDDEECDKSEKPPMPAARRKKLIAAPKISLNPFWDEDDENEDDGVKTPVPKPRVLRSSVGVPEPKPRESGGLSVSTRNNFGSNSSISSGSAYGSIRKKKPAPKPPVPFVRNENHESAASSLTSSPSHSVQHSPRLTPKYRKSKKAPPPPSRFSTPIPPHKETRDEDKFSLSNISPIKLTATDPVPKDIDIKEAEASEDNIGQEKNVKDEMNRNRQSQNLNLQSPSSSENSSSLSAPNKSTYGKWKRRKGLAPTRPIPQKRSIKCLPMTEIRRELQVIEIQQQGLERQGVRLEQIIREKCEGAGVDSNNEDNLPIEVEDLILQLFELVNEKNELFRKQAELMYLRRQQRLEEEHADVEYQIRCLMLQPEANKTDSDKAREEELINRLVEIVERRNEIIECLEMDRVREAEEDDSINNHINLYTLKRDGEKPEPNKSEISKEKKKHKKEKKFKYKLKGNKLDADKDIDESENCTTLEKKKEEKIQHILNCYCHEYLFKILSLFYCLRYIFSTFVTYIL